MPKVLLTEKKEDLSTEQKNQNNINV